MMISIVYPSATAYLFANVFILILVLLLFAASLNSANYSHHRDAHGHK